MPETWYLASSTSGWTKCTKTRWYDCHAEDEFACRWYLANAFQPFVKPGVISPTLPEKEEQ
jgi:hypothetical protein